MSQYQDDNEWEDWGPSKSQLKRDAEALQKMGEEIVSLSHSELEKIPLDEELAEAVARVREGDAVFSPRLAGFVLDAFSGSIPEAEADPDLDLLTLREREVLRLIARGYLYKEVAQQLGISARTVENHVSAVLRKLQLSNRHELSRWAVERRLVD